MRSIKKEVEKEEVEELEDKGEDITEEEAEEIKQATEKPAATLVDKIKNVIKPVKVKKEKLKCPECGSLNIELGYLFDGRWQYHYIERAKSNGKPQYKCNSCEHKFFR